MPGKQGSNLFATVILNFWPCPILFLLFSDIVSDSGQAASLLLSRQLFLQTQYSGPQTSVSL